MNINPSMADVHSVTTDPAYIIQDHQEHSLQRRQKRFEGPYGYWWRDCRWGGCSYGFRCQICWGRWTCTPRHVYC